jgi:hypothetical protein
MNISNTCFMSSFEPPKLQRPPETFVPSVLKEQPENGLLSSSKAILTQVTFHDWGSHVVHLVGYGGDCPL